MAARILAVLPQTQCARCAYPDCAAYAQAITQGLAAINQCPPGGAQGIERLAAVTGQPLVALNPANGTEGPRSVAYIDEDWCIGCTLCLDACPTDAIMGSNKLMHTVVEAWCTGCELCLAVCPVDCIKLENVSGNATGWAAWSQEQADLARSRYDSNGSRRRRVAAGNARELEGQPPLDNPDRLDAPTLDAVAKVKQRQAVIEAAIARASLKRDRQPAN